MKSLVYNPDAVVEVTKEFTFDAAHYLEKYDGACSQLHGHTYKLQVTVKGKPDEIGIVEDFTKMKKTIETLVLKNFDHACLNDVVGFNPTAENLAVFIYSYLKEYYSQSDRLELVSVKLWETPTSFVIYKGEWS